MPQNLKQHALADPRRFKTIQDLTKMRPDCGASIDDMFIIDNGFLLIVDIAHIGGIMNPYGSPSASYVRTHGVIVASHVRNAPFPLIWRDPFLLLPLSCHLKEYFGVYADIGKVLGSVSCPSGTFLFLTFHKDMPTPLENLTDEALEKETGARLKIPNGTYRVFYEQFETPEGSKKEFYQNIAVQRQ